MHSFVVVLVSGDSFVSGVCIMYKRVIEWPQISAVLSFRFVASSFIIFFCMFFTCLLHIRQRLTIMKGSMYTPQTLFEQTHSSVHTPYAIFTIYAYIHYTLYIHAIIWRIYNIYTMIRVFGSNPKLIPIVCSAGSFHWLISIGLLIQTEW